MPNDDARVLAVLRRLNEAPYGQMRTADAVRIADPDETVHGRHVLDGLGKKGWVEFLGYGQFQEVRITGAGRNELAYHEWVAIAPDAPAETPQGAPDRAGLLAAHRDLLAEVLLQLLYHSTAERGAPLESPTLCPQPDPAVNRYFIVEAVRLLESQASICVLRMDLPPELPEVALTAQGAERAIEARAIMADTAARRQAARGAVLAWLHDRQDDRRGTVHLDWFFGDRRSACRGQFFSPCDIGEAARYLHSNNLIGGKGIGKRRRPVIAWITATGIDCIERGGNIDECDAAKATAADSAARLRAPVVAFCSAVTALGVAAATLIATVGKTPTSSPWFILSLAVAAAAAFFLVSAGFPDMLRWLGSVIGGARRSGRRAR